MQVLAWRLIVVLRPKTGEGGLLRLELVSDGRLTPSISVFPLAPCRRFSVCSLTWTTLLSYVSSNDRLYSGQLGYLRTLEID